MVLSRREFYDHRAGLLSAGDSEARLRARRAAEIAELAPGMTLLDLGCGRALLGEVVRALQPDVEYFGADLSAAVLKRSDSAAERHLVALDASVGLPFATGSFDRIFALEALEHLESPLACLREVRRVLGERGLAIVSVPNPQCWNELVGNLRGGRESEGHLYSWTPQTMAALAAVAGLTVRRRRGTYARIPLSRRLLGRRYRVFPANALCLARSLIYVLAPTTEPSQ